MPTEIQREAELIAAERALATGRPTPIDAGTVERVLLHGDLSRLSPSQKISYYRAVCESVGLNPLTQPFQYLVLNGKEILYARREATEQLRQLHQVSISITARELLEGEVYVVTARATLPTGRTDENIGAVNIAGLRGEAKANALMKAETKSKRRVTLSICGLGMLDESEVASLPSDAVGVPEPPAVERPAYATTANTAPAADLPPGTVRVMRVDSSPTKKNPNLILFRITLSTGEVVQTFKSDLVNEAEAAIKANVPVVVKTKETPFGMDLVSLKPYVPPSLPREEGEPLTADDIPF